MFVAENDANNMMMCLKCIQCFDVEWKLVASESNKFVALFNIVNSEAENE